METSPSSRRSSARSAPFSSSCRGIEGCFLAASAYWRQRKGYSRLRSSPARISSGCIGRSCSRGSWQSCWRDSGSPTCCALADAHAGCTPGCGALPHPGRPRLAACVSAAAAVRSPCRGRSRVLLAVGDVTSTVGHALACHPDRSVHRVERDLTAVVTRPQRGKHRARLLPLPLCRALCDCRAHAVPRLAAPGTRGDAGRADDGLRADRPCAAGDAHAALCALARSRERVHLVFPRQLGVQ